MSSMPLDIFLKSLTTSSVIYSFPTEVLFKAIIFFNTSEIDTI